jgi:hypothetical protein
VIRANGARGKLPSSRVCLIAKERIWTKEREREKYLLFLFCFFSKIFVKKKRAKRPPLCWVIFFFLSAVILLEQLTDFSFLSSLFNDARLEKTKKQSINPNANRPS